jgi:hypothetical protein
MRISVGKHVEKNRFGDPGINGRIIIKWILHEMHGFVMGRPGFGCGQV